MPTFQMPTGGQCPASAQLQLQVGLCVGPWHLASGRCMGMVAGLLWSLACAACQGVPYSASEQSSSQSFASMHVPNIPRCVRLWFPSTTRCWRTHSREATGPSRQLVVSVGRGETWMANLSCHCCRSGAVSCCLLASVCSPLSAWPQSALAGPVSRTLSIWKSYVWQQCASRAWPLVTHGQCRCSWCP